MSRSTVEDLPSPHPLVESLPGLFQNDGFIVRFLDAIDTSLAPVFSLLDGGFEAHLDPDLVPEDFVPWLGAWLGLVMEEGWDSSHRRSLIANAVELYRWRGTVQGLADAVAVFAGEVPTILESGGVAWSTVPGGEVPGVSPPQIVVQVRLPAEDTAGLGRIDRVVALAKPAHLSHRVEAI